VHDVLHYLLLKIIYIYTHQILCINIITIKFKNENNKMKVTRKFTPKHIKTRCDFKFFFLNNKKLHMYQKNLK
jgi:hypothetical protein